MAKLTKTEQAIMDAIESHGEFHHSSGTCQAGVRSRRLQSYGRRIANAIMKLEKRGLVSVDKETTKGQIRGGNWAHDTSWIVTAL